MICLSGSAVSDTNFEIDRRKERRQITTHHVYSESCFGELRHFAWNKVSCTWEVHDLIHEVFGNRTPGQSVQLLYGYWRLVGYRIGQEAIDFLDHVYWRGMSMMDSGAESVGLGDWKKHPIGDEQKHILFAVFHRQSPWKIARWIRRLDVLTGCRYGEEAVSFLSGRYWNGFTSDEWAMLQWSLVRRIPKQRRAKHERRDFHRRPLFRLRSA